MRRHRTPQATCTSGSFEASCIHVSKELCFPYVCSLFFRALCVAHSAKEAHVFGERHPRGPRSLLNHTRDLEQAHDHYGDGFLKSWPAHECLRRESEYIAQSFLLLVDVIICLEGGRIAEPVRRLS